jgi:hypothetical protein
MSVGHIELEAAVMVGGGQGVGVERDVAAGVGRILRGEMFEIEKIRVG